MWLSHDLRSHDLMNGDLFNCLRFYKQTMRSRAQLIEHHFLRRLCEMFSHFSKYFVRCPLFQIQGNCWNSGEQHQWWTSGSNRWNRCPILLTAVLNQVPFLSNCVGFFLSVCTADSTYHLKVSEVLWSCLVRCWSDKVYLSLLSHRFWKLTLQLYARYAKFLDEVILKAPVRKFSNQSIQILYIIIRRQIIFWW